MFVAFPLEIRVATPFALADQLPRPAETPFTRRVPILVAIPPVAAPTAVLTAALEALYCFWVPIAMSVPCCTVLLTRPTAPPLAIPAITTEAPPVSGAFTTPSPISAPPTTAPATSPQDIWCPVATSLIASIPKPTVPPKAKPARSSRPNANPEESVLSIGSSPT